MPTNEIYADARVVVLDAGRQNQILLRTLLRQLGLRQVDVFADPDEALGHLAQVAVDLVLVDLHLPRGNGIDWVRRLRRHRTLANRDLGVVMTATQVVRAMLEPAVVAGIDGFLAKPLSPETLDRHLRRVLTRRAGYVVGPDAYWGPDFRRTRQRLHEIHRGVGGHGARVDSLVAPPSPLPPRPLPRAVPGLDVEIGDRSRYGSDLLFVD